MSESSRYTFPLEQHKVLAEQWKIERRKAIAMVKVKSSETASSHHGNQFSKIWRTMACKTV